MSLFIHIKPSHTGGKEFTKNELQDLTHYLEERGYTIESLEISEEHESLNPTKQQKQQPNKQLEKQQKKRQKHKEPTKLVCESVLPVSQDISLITSIIKCHLTQLNAQHELLIIDPYFFPEKVENKDYLAKLKTTFSGAMLTLDRVKILVRPRFNIILKNQFFQWLQSINPKLETELIESDVFHDRFIIADGKRGVFVGTSLNGIGRKYALIDDMRNEDAQEIYALYLAETKPQNEITTEEEL